MSPGAALFSLVLVLTKRADSLSYELAYFSLPLMVTTTFMRLPQRNGNVILG